MTKWKVTVEVTVEQDNAFDAADRAAVLLSRVVSDAQILAVDGPVL